MTGHPHSSALTVAPRRRLTREFALRAASAAVLAPLGVAVVWIGGPAFDVWVAAVGGLCLYEWMKLTGVRNDDRAAPSQGRLVLAVLGAASIIFAAAALAVLRRDADGRTLVLGLLIIVWATDTGSYLIGSTLKGPLLSARISPTKTWSGLLGGFLTGFFAGLGMRLFADTGWSVIDVAAAGAMVALSAQIGDLAESAVKRRFDVKDTGTLIPGHGGALDRLDGTLAAAIAAGLVYGAMRFL